MVLLAGDVDQAIRARTDAGVYADVFATVKEINETSANFAENKCYHGFVGGLSGGSVRDQTCTAYGFSLRLQWQTLTTQLDTAETGVFPIILTPI